jgi:PAS domain-containing protein
VMGTAREHTHGISVRQGDPKVSKPALRVPIEHGGHRGVRIDLEEAVRKGGRRIGAEESHRSMRENAPDGLAVGDEEVSARRNRWRRAREGRAERLTIAAVQAPTGGLVQAGHERPWVKRRGRARVRHRISHRSGSVRAPAGP